jgi:glycosyltransferase involved in cell wall biosynthesis
MLGARGLTYESARDLARLVAKYLNPLARLAWRRAELVLVQNEDTRRWMPKKYRSKAEVFPHVVLDEVPPPRDTPRQGTTPTALYAGRLLEGKGAVLAVRAIELLPEWRLSIVGAGPDEARLRRMVRKRGLTDRVSFSSPVPREELLRRMREEADVFLFPSFHDEAGWVVAEAASCGLPVVCLDVGGPPALGGQAVQPSWPQATAMDLAGAVRAASSRPSAPGLRLGLKLSLKSRRRQLERVLAVRGILPALRSP